MRQMPVLGWFSVNARYLLLLTLQWRWDLVYDSSREVLVFVVQYSEAEASVVFIAVSRVSTKRRKSQRHMKMKDSDFTNTRTGTH
jgi:hypothetical protein